MTFTELKKYKILLASKSPRRHELIKGLNLDFCIKTKNTEELVPDTVTGEEIAVYLSELKANAFESGEIGEKEILVTADTIVLLDGELLGKPKNRQDAFQMLSRLSGKKHTVVTGVTLRTQRYKKSFKVCSDVYFRVLSEEEINYYIDTYHPYDKAGSYGIQEWIGFIAIDRIEGSYFNVMGLPVHRLYQELLNCEL